MHSGWQSLVQEWHQELSGEACPWSLKTETNQSAQLKSHATPHADCRLKFFCRLCRQALPRIEIQFMHAAVEDTTHFESKWTHDGDGSCDTPCWQ